MDEMPDRSPPPGRRRAPQRLLGIALAAVLVLGATLWAVRWAVLPGSGEKAVQRQVAAQLPSRTAQAPSRSSRAAPAPTHTPTPRPRPNVPHDQVAAAAPTAFSITGKGFRINADVCGMEYVRPLDPPGDQHHTVCWVQHDFGFAPASKASGTTYVLGHAWGQDRLEVLNKVSETAMRQVLHLRAQHRTSSVSGIPTYPVTRLNGYLITLRTPRGVLRYTVKDAYAVAKMQAGDVRSLMAERTRNRVVIITCGELDNVDYDYNIIVEAYLTSSVATKSPT